MPDTNHDRKDYTTNHRPNNCLATSRSEGVHWLIEPFNHGHGVSVR